MKTIPVFAAVLVAAIAAAGIAEILPARGSVPEADRESSAASVRRLDATTIAPGEIDTTVTRLMTAGKVTGLGLAILADGQIAYLKAYGIRDKEKNLPLTTDSVMSAASFTKVAFAYLVMQLLEEDTLSLDKPVYEYLPKPLPEFEPYKDLAGDPRYKKITARMLLSHTSGLPNWRWFTDEKKLQIYFEPGARFAYSGEGIALLQLVVENVTKRGLKELMDERVFGPLKMTRSSMVWESRFEDDYANGYD